ncbi:hypothetical protein ACFDTO_38155 [Microbacteriaceae bacterium 4G12]
MKAASMFLLAIVLLSQVFFAFNYLQSLHVQSYSLWFAISIIGICAAGLALKSFRNAVILSSIVLFGSMGTLGVLGFQYFISHLMG